MRAGPSPEAPVGPWGLSACAVAAASPRPASWRWGLCLPGPFSSPVTAAQQGPSGDGPGQPRGGRLSALMSPPAPVPGSACASVSGLLSPWGAGGLGWTGPGRGREETEDLRVGYPPAPKGKCVGEVGAACADQGGVLVR